MKYRSAESGRAVSENFAKKNKRTTIREGKSKDTLRLDAIVKNDWWIQSDDDSFYVVSGDGLH